MGLRTNNFFMNLYVQRAYHTNLDVFFSFVFINFRENITKKHPPIWNTSSTNILILHNAFTFVNLDLFIFVLIKLFQNVVVDILICFSLYIYFSDLDSFFFFLLFCLFLMYDTSKEVWLILWILTVKINVERYSCVF